MAQRKMQKNSKRVHAKIPPQKIDVPVGYAIVKLKEVKPRRFNWFAFIGLTVLFNIFGLVGYLIYYGARKK